MAETRFASKVVILKRFQEIKQSLRLMVVTEKWADYKNDNVEGARARSVEDKILDDCSPSQIGRAHV